MIINSANAQELKLLEPVSKSSFRGLDVLSDSIWWVSGQRNTVMYTVDAGKSWETMLVGDTSKHTDFRDVEVINEKTVLVMGITEPALFYKTVDGGKTWKKTFEDTAKSAFLDAVDFWDEKNGICIGDPVNDRWTLLTSSDGGESWKPLKDNQRPEAQPLEAAFAAGGTALRVFGKNEVAFVTGGAENSRLLISKNRGKNWSYVFPLIKSSKSAGIFSLEKPTEDLFVLVGGDYQNPKDSSSNVALVSNEKKMMGVTVLGDHVPGGYRCAVASAGNGVLIATGDEGTDISYDNGQSWKLLSSEGFYAVDCAAKSCVLSGKKGKIGLIKL